MRHLKTTMTLRVRWLLAAVSLIGQLVFEIVRGSAFEVVHALSGGLTACIFAVPLALAAASVPSTGMHFGERLKLRLPVMVVVVVAITLAATLLLPAGSRPVH